MISNLYAALDRIIPGNGYSVTDHQVGAGLAALAILLWIIIAGKRAHE